MAFLCNDEQPNLQICGVLLALCQPGIWPSLLLPTVGSRNLWVPTATHGVVATCSGPALVTAQNGMEGNKCQLLPGPFQSFSHFCLIFTQLKDIPAFSSDWNHLHPYICISDLPPFLLSYFIWFDVPERTAEALVMRTLPETSCVTVDKLLNLSGLQLCPQQKWVSPKAKVLVLGLCSVPMSWLQCALSRTHHLWCFLLLVAGAGEPRGKCLCVGGGVIFWYAFMTHLSSPY